MRDHATNHAMSGARAAEWNSTGGRAGGKLPPNLSKSTSSEVGGNGKGTGSSTIPGSSICLGLSYRDAERRQLSESIMQILMEIECVPEKISQL